MGNPHAVFFVADAEAVDLATLGPAARARSAVSRARQCRLREVLAPDRIRLRVWERGAGITLACGTGACAALVAAHRRGLTGRRATVVLDGGELEIEWRDDGHVLMTGPAALAFERRVRPSPPYRRRMASVEIVTFGCRLNAYESEVIRARRRRRRWPTR